MGSTLSIGNLFVSGILLAHFSCGRVGYDLNPQETTDDAGLMDGSSSDGAVLGDFGAAIAVSALNSASRDDDPTLTADQLLLLFSSDRVGGKGDVDLWASTRASIDLPWSSPLPVAELNTSGQESGPEISRDGLSLYYATEVVGASGEIVLSTRTSRNDPWGPPTILSELNSAKHDGSATTDISQTVLTFSSQREGPTDIFQSRRATKGDPWQAPQLLNELNSPGTDTTPMLLGDGLVIYYTSDGLTGAAGRDLYRASRVSLDADFSIPVPITELNTADLDTDPWVSDDEQVIYFSRGGSVGADIYMAER